jgi:indolepyruvate ferredoxin oxidoreductase beta subunit
MKQPDTRSIRIAILAMGGEGGGVLADWIVGMAEANGHIAQLTSVPGVAQRTGATNYYIELFPRSVLPPGRQPVLALTPFPGDVDVVVASELMEAGRAIQRGLVTPDRTTLVASTARTYAMTERLAMADGRADSAKLLEACRIAAHRLVAVDLAAIAEQERAVISAAMFGALAGARVLPFPPEAFKAAIEHGGIGVAASARAFDRALAAARDGDRSALPDTAPAIAAADGGNDSPADPFVAALEARARGSLPSQAHDFACEGVARLVDYQDAAYAELYLDRLGKIADIDRLHGDGSHRLTTETARWLALGMSYEDTIRVAELKIRASRFDRVRQEVRLEAGQQIEIAEFLHPRLQEIAESVPAPLGRFLQRNTLVRAVIGRMTASGKIVNTTSIRGFLLMSAVASLKPRRRASIRYAAEQAALEAWLADLAAFAAKSYDMALEIAECRRLVKGYGDTHERGRRSYAAILEQARTLPPGGDAAAHIAVLRNAALEDEGGAKLQRMLGQLQSHRGAEQYIARTGH